MSAVSVTCRRTLSRLRSFISTALASALFLAAGAALFAYNLQSAEGSHQLLSVLWATSVSPFLPVLAAFLAMDVWSEERRTGAIDLLLTTAVSERDFVVGKTLGVFYAMALLTLLSLASSVSILLFYAPTATLQMPFLTLATAFVTLLLEAALWSAASVAVSALFTHGFSAAVTSLVLFAALPRGLWMALQLWSSAGRSAFGEYPVDALTADAASGSFTTGSFALILLLISLSLFLATEFVGVRRLVGRGGRGKRRGCAVASLLAVLCAAALALLAFRLDFPFELPVAGNRGFAPCVRQVLSEATGHVTASVFLSRKSPSFRPVARYVRALRRQAEALGGLSVTLRFVDPNWDFGSSSRLVRRGVRPGSLVFERGGRLASVALRESPDDREIASVLGSIALPPQRRDVYWTRGHGEIPFDDYGPWGMSDIARELSRNGYHNASIDLSSDQVLPASCALIAVAGAKEAFSRAELGRLDAYLRGGGRLLVLLSAPGEGGVSSLLPAWGIRPTVVAWSHVPTLSGSDVVVSEFADHPLSTGLAGASLVLERPLSFVSSAVAQSGSGADRLEYASVARVGASGVIAAVERGGTLRGDLAIRPTRIVAIGDASFVVNGQLAARGHANSVFFMNAVAYLSGASVSPAGAREPGVLITRLDRHARRHFVVASVLAFPCVVFVLLAIVVLVRRRRR